MVLSENLVKTWGEMNIPLIEEVYEKVASQIEMEYPDDITRNKIKTHLEEALPDYIIKCDEENNPPNVVDSGVVMVEVRTPTKPDGSFNYINVIF